MNNKILRLALLAQAPDIDAIILLIEASSEPEIAALVALGVYEGVEPNQEPSPKFFSNNKSISNVKFLSYNPISDIVRYSYDSHTMEEYWISTGDTYTEFNTHPYISKAKFWNIGILAEELGITKDEASEKYYAYSIQGAIRNKNSKGTSSSSNWAAE